MEKIIITGASGQLGQTLLKSLSDQFQILAVSRKPIGKDGTFEWTTYEELSVKDMGCEVLVHVAGVHPRTQPTPTISDYVNVNIDLFKRILELASNGGTKKFVFISTHYLNQNTQVDWNQQKPLLYPTTKFLGESMLYEARDSFPLSVSLRLPGIVMPKLPASSFLVEVANKLRLNQEVELANERKPFEFLDGVMVAEWIASLARCKDVQGHFTSTICSQPVWTLLDIVQNIGRAMREENLEIPEQTIGNSLDSLQKKMGYSPLRTEDVVSRFIVAFKESL